MKNIAIIGVYPTSQNIKDGMVQRIKAIDDVFENDNRIYLKLSYRRKTNKLCRISDKLSVYELNVMFNYSLILKQLNKADCVYCHSLFNFINLILFLPFVKVKIVLDLHGVVPEELSMSNRKIKSFIYSICEYFAFKYISAAIAVSENMIKHYKKKYPSYKGMYLKYFIYPGNIINNNFGKELANSSIPNDKPVVIYSGNAQAWQNVQLMMKTIKKEGKPYEYIILTGEPSFFLDLISRYGLEDFDIKIYSVQPDELFPFYKRANYGFILRDESIVNKVANPTKLIEYLSYGIVPIVLTDDIGDFLNYGYEYLKLDNFNSDLKPVKSFKNMNISSIIKSENINLVNFLKDIV